MSLKNKAYVFLILGLTPVVFLVVFKFGKSTSTLKIFITEYIVFAYLGVITFTIYSTCLRKNELSSIDVLSEEHIKVLDFAFIIFFSLIIYSLRSAIYVKPLHYYIFVSMASTALGIQILFSNKITKKQTNKILIQILSLAIIIRFSSSLINPYLIGWDSYFHYNAILNVITKTRLLPIAQHYYYYPFFHLLNIDILILTLISKNILNLVGLISGTIAIWIMYYIGKEISNVRIGLLSALLLTLSTFHIYRSMGFSRPEVTFILLCLLTIIKAPDYGLSRSWVIFWISAIAVFFIHPSGTIVLLSILCANFVIKNLQSRMKEKNYKNTIMPFVSYAIGFIAYLEFVHYTLFVDMVNIIFVPVDEVVPLITHVAPEVMRNLTKIYYIEAYLTFLGMSTLVFFSFVGGLKWLRKFDPIKFTILLGIILVYMIPIYSVIRGYFEAQPSRFLLYGNILMIIPAAVGIIMLFEIIKGKNQKIVFGIILILIFSFFSVTSHIAGDDSGILNRELPFDQRHATQSTLAIAHFISKRTDVRLQVDDEAQRYLFSGKRGIIEAMGDDGQVGSVSEKGLFVINIPKLEGGYIWGIKRGRSFLDNFKEDEKVYENGAVVIYEKR